MSQVILAFSGGLDTTFCVPYFQEQGLEVITATINTGGFSKEELLEIAQKSKDLGAIEHFEIDAQEELYNDFISYIIKANFLKGGTYPSCVGTERVITAIKIADLAKKKGILKIAHGSTAAGNDQVRFDTALQTLLPGCEIINPIRDKELKREEEFEYLKTKGIEIDQSTKDYSINVGLLGTSIGGKETKSTEENIPDNIFPSVLPIDQTPDTKKEITITFEKGLPVSLNGIKKSGVEIIQELNNVCAQYGYGKDYHIGTTIIGLKGRLAFEAPALKALIKTHIELEKITLTSKQSTWKDIIGQQYGNYIHEALYFEPVMRDFEQFLDSANEYVSGDVTIELYKGHLTVIKMESPYSLLNSKIGEYGEEAKGWSGLEAKGFCKLYGFESKSAFSTHNLI